MGLSAGYATLSVGMSPSYRMDLSRHVQRGVLSLYQGTINHPMAAHPRDQLWYWCPVLLVSIPLTNGATPSDCAYLVEQGPTVPPALRWLASTILTYAIGTSTTYTESVVKLETCSTVSCA